VDPPVAGKSADALSAEANALTLVCALRVEARLAQRAGARTALVGLRAHLPIPDGQLVSFGFAGALESRLQPGTLVTATKVVDVSGATLWEGEPLRVEGAEPAVICVGREVADSPEARRMIAETTRAEAIDLESGVLARTGRLAGVVRAVSDAGDRPLGLLASAATPDGGTNWKVVARAFATEPRASLRTARDARKAMRALSRAAKELA
jgi:adenosylhomocysteine nucleosidase